MAFVIIVAMLMFLFASINPILKHFGKSEIDNRLIIPAGLFLVMCYITYELKINFLHTVIIFGFGVIIGALVENILIRGCSEIPWNFSDIRSLEQKFQLHSFTIIHPFKYSASLRF